MPKFKYTAVNIKKEKDNKEQYMDLLLEADPSENMINEYLKDGDLFVLTYENEIVCVAVVTKVDDNTCELKNIATKEEYRNKGYAKKMLKYLCDNYKQKYNKMLVGTTENNIPFYVKQGFDKYEKTLKEVFDLKEEKNNLTDIPDYEVFSDKALLDSLRNKIVQSAIDNNIPNNKNLNTYINEEIDKALEGYDLSSLERNHIFNLIENEINGYGPLTELLDDPNITEIMVNGPSEIYIELDGKIIKDDTVSFINEDHILRTIQRMIQPLGRTIDLSTPMVDSRLKDGSRINAVIPPLSLNGPIITIRKFKRNLNNIEDLIRNGTLTPYMARFLDACVKAKLNILVCGGTGSGKTTILNVLSSFINDDERIITIEDAAELKLKQEHVITLETRNTNYEQEKEITIRDLVINALRMRPDRIIVGEVRGKEVEDVVNTSMKFFQNIDSSSGMPRCVSARRCVPSKWHVNAATDARLF